MNWCLFVYRKLCEVDVSARQDGCYGMKRFEYLRGSEADMRFFFAEFCRSDQVLAVELINNLGSVVDRQDRLVELVDRLKTDKVEGGIGYWPVVEAVVERRLLEKPSSLPAELLARRAERAGG
jgi:hypothetical protein